MSDLKKYNPEAVKKILTNQLNDALESVNADHQFEVVKVDLVKAEFIVKFNIHVVEEDNYIGIAGY